MGRPPNSGVTSFRFLPTEVTEMEKALEASNGATPARHILEALTTMFSDSVDRNGQLPIQYKQVWNWFQNRRHSQKVKMSKTAEKLNDATGASDLSISRKSATATGVVPQAKKTNDVQELEFEAKSARDSAWYDVSMFLDHRISDAGEPEVKVRYTGFGPEEDEWVHIKTAVRQRSLPCEVLECVAVLPGDLILCFQAVSKLSTMMHTFWMSSDVDMMLEVVDVDFGSVIFMTNQRRLCHFEKFVGGLKPSTA
ncbi:hypothetical protein O6H91_20G005500 [Diphasiastrum complanatum]|uniref:Uncharacterized protein n=1 Tax=Diphasiastrum complanatum TaxID=34168 RepID=A0ACC2ANL1_DIPCM|nr:hypothetical protein O6H91_20G005500 [Diphasiastrum complanatum]